MSAYKCSLASFDVSIISRVNGSLRLGFKQLAGCDVIKLLNRKPKVKISACQHLNNSAPHFDSLRLS